jgi:hypothetical protein
MLAATGRVHGIELSSPPTKLPSSSSLAGRLTGVCDSLSDPKGEEDDAQRDHEEA